MATGALSFCGKASAAARLASLKLRHLRHRLSLRVGDALPGRSFQHQALAVIVARATNLVSSVVDDETQKKIDVVKQRLIKYFGYNEVSATDVLNYVASIFARGDTKGE